MSGTTDVTAASGASAGKYLCVGVLERQLYQRRCCMRPEQSGLLVVLTIWMRIWIRIRRSGIGESRFFPSRRG